MVWIIVIALVYLVFAFPSFRCALQQPYQVARYGIVDAYHNYKRHKTNLVPTGELVAYCGLFGKGKTLSVVHRVVSTYNRYNGRLVWCPRRKKLVTQVVKVISNVQLSIPFERFESLSQIVRCAESNSALDDSNDTLTVTLVLGDEFSVQMNSRNFKTNIDPMFLNTILTCRHYHMSLYYTAQRFGHVDALLRQVTSEVIQCDKLWRFQRQYVYSAWEMENATNESLIAPIARRCWFVRDSDYAAYDTLATVGNLTHSCKSGDMLTAEQILALQTNTNQPNMEGVANPSRKFMRMQRKMRK